MTNKMPIRIEYHNTNSMTNKNNNNSRAYIFENRRLVWQRQVSATLLERISGRLFNRGNLCTHTHKRLHFTFVTINNTY